MIPIFPKFKKLELSDRHDVETFTSQIPPYSDFSFASMWLWNHDDETVISNLNGNLVVRLTDSRTGGSFYSFVGTRKCNQTANELLQHLNSQRMKAELRLLPEVSAGELEVDKFVTMEDRDNFDYIFCTRQLSLMAGSEFATHRREMNGFASNDNEFHQLDLTDKSNQKKLLNCLESWTLLKNTSGITKESWEIRCFEAEQTSFERLFLFPELLPSLACFGLFVDGVLAGFSIGETIRDYFILHFHKSNYKHKGTTEYLFQMLARKLLETGINYLNDEEDLGLPGLRFNKSRYRPVHFLKKYTVRRIERR